MSVWLALALFVGGAAALVGIGTSLAASGDELAERTGWSRLLVGTLLVAFATSMPELATDVSAAVADAPDLAVGDLFGSSMANMAILAIIDLSYRGRVWPTVELGHARVAAVGMVLTSVAVLAILTPPGVALGWVGVDTIAIAGLYVAAVAWFRRVPVVGRPAGTEQGVALQEPVGLGRTSSPRPLRAVVVRFGLAALGILLTAPVVAASAKVLSEASGVDQTFVGTTLLAVTTSLPELIVAFAAIRIGAHDLAVGNLFGSNAANMSVLLIVDLAYRDGPILAAVDPAQATAGVGAILLMALAVAAIVGGTETRIKRLEPDAVVLLLAYLGALAAVLLVS